MVFSCPASSRNPDRDHNSSECVPSPSETHAGLDFHAGESLCSLLYLAGIRRRGEDRGEPRCSCSKWMRIKKGSIFKAPRCYQFPGEGGIFVWALILFSLNSHSGGLPA